jgi:hypothetical protein
MIYILHIYIFLKRLLKWFLFILFIFLVHLKKLITIFKYLFFLIGKIFYCCNQFFLYYYHCKLKKKKCNYDYKKWKNVILLMLRNNKTILKYKTMNSSFKTIIIKMIWKKNNDNLSFKKKKYQTFKYILWILQNMNIFRTKTWKTNLLFLKNII